MKNNFKSQSGRSMVEMLGTLAIIGVLSIGGIAGYSYAVDKYHANQIMNDVNLRAIDLIAQSNRGGDFTLDEWPTKTSADYDIGLEVDESTNTTEGGIYVKDVAKRICEIIADDLLPADVELVIDGEEYTSGNCGETNKMVFYYDEISNGEGEKFENCEGMIINDVCTPCPESTTWSEEQKACLCSDGNKIWDFETSTCLTACGEIFYNVFKMNGEKGNLVTTSGTTATLNIPNNETVVLTKNVEYSSNTHCSLNITGGQNVVLELNGRDITLKNLTINGNINIQDNTDTMLDGTGMGRLTALESVIISDADITIRSGKIVTYLNGIFISDSTFTMNGGSFIDESYTFSISNSNINVNGGTFGHLDYNIKDSSIIITGGNVGDSIQYSNFNLTDSNMSIEGGTVSGWQINANGSSEVNIDGGAVEFTDFICSGAGKFVISDYAEVNVYNMACSNIENN